MLISPHNCAKSQWFQPRLVNYVEKLRFSNALARILVISISGGQSKLDKHEASHHRNATLENCIVVCPTTNDYAIQYVR
jgi:hypothetical protein